jgi:hypothetical protein
MTSRPIPGFSNYVAYPSGVIQRTSDSYVFKSATRYKAIEITDNTGVTAFVPISRLVCLAFHGLPPHEKAICTFRDGNPGNCRATNLYWSTHSAITNRAIKSGRITPRIGASNKSSTLTANDVRDIRRAYTSKHGQMTAIARAYGVSIQTIFCIVHNKTWRHVKVPA